MKTVNSMISDILRREGGYVNHSNDRGGPTNYGVTQATLSRFLGKRASVQDVKNLSEATARQIYRVMYYETAQIGRLPSAIRPQVFDMSINHGPRRAVRFVQRVCNLAGFGPLVEDGINGPKTSRAARRAQECMGKYLTRALVDERVSFYRGIVANDASQSVFLRGWLARAEEFRV